MEDNLYKCNLCKQPILNKRGKCEYCGWVQQEELDQPDKIHWSYNFISFNKAKQLFKEGKPLKPDFDDFIECMQVYNELEFYYKGKHYGVIIGHSTIHFYEWNMMEKGYQKYATLKDFAENANIEGCLLKNIWPFVEKVGTAS